VGGARHIVGIDLGTSNTVVAHATLGEPAPRILPIAQRISATTIEDAVLLPSCAFATLTGEAPPEARLGELDGWVLGELAKRRAAEVPGRAITSSKSWLGHARVDRRAAILPWGGDDEAPKLSPVDVATRLLERVRSSWETAHPGAPLAEQELVLTVPASFDEVARELTLEAAKRAGLTPKLLEEPQAAFYRAMHEGSLAPLEAGLAVGQRARILVVDVGGGTTDLSLLELEKTDRESPLLERVAVGAHLLLGGDNMDLALAHALEPRLVAPPDKLDPRRFAELVLACRAAKERLLAKDGPTELRVAVLGRGSQLLGGQLSTTLTRAEVEAIVLDGFLPIVAPGERPPRTRGGLVAFGLPYERDVAITRHLAGFLTRHLPQGASIDAVLLNGGVFHARRIAERVLEALGALGGRAPLELRHPDPDLAVALGAVSFGLSLHGRGARIGGGAPRSFYVGLGVGDDDKSRAVCVVPKGTREGERLRLDERPLRLLVGTPARFELYTSDRDTGAEPGQLVEVDDELDELPPLRASLGDERGRGKELDVVLHAELSPVGTLELSCIERAPNPGAEARRFQLSFDLRGDSSEASPEHARVARSVKPATKLHEALAEVERVYGKIGETSERDAKNLVRELERLLGEREGWSADVSRALADGLLAGQRNRRRTADHERVYFQLVGYCLRPGLGAPGDEARVGRLVPALVERLAFPTEARGWQQLFVCARRVAAGLSEASQLELRDRFDGFVAPREAQRKKPKGPAPLSESDLFDLLASLERVPAARRSELGEWILERTWTSRDPRWWAAIGRLGARAPAYASLHHVVPTRDAERWLDQLLRDKWTDLPTAARAASELARLTGDRARDVSERVRSEVDRRLERERADARLVRVVREVVPADELDLRAFLGERLPTGLRLA
jgi:molecular chaperone DnaK (HSP70)